MGTLFQVALSNALGAAVLALAAILVSHALRRPAVTRALWLIVLLKFVTPPVWTVHLHYPTVAARQKVESKSRPVVPPVHEATIATAAVAEVPEIMPAAEGIALLSESRDSEPVTASPAAPLTRSRISAAFRNVTRHWQQGIVILWLAGSGAYLFGIGITAFRMRRLMRLAEFAPPSLQQRVAALARRMGIIGDVGVWFVPLPVPPMLWAIGVSPRLILPVGLWSRLTEEQRDAVLGHELAHLRRRDHWVRALELVVSALYWWHPAVWLARRELNEASEQCCDAWVLWAMPRAGRSYASALVEAIDYISTARSATPVLASGMGQFTDLKRRLVMIKQGTVRRTLSWPGSAAVCGLAGLLLPLAPSFGQSSPAPEPPPPTAALSAGGPGSPAPTGPAPVGAGGPALTTAALPSTPPVAPEAGVTAAPPESRMDLDEARHEIQRLRAALVRAEERLAEMEGRRRPDAPSGYGIGSATPSMPGGMAAGSYGRGGMMGGARAGGGGGSASSSDDQDRRLAALERQMSVILRELRQLKSDRRASDQPQPTPEGLQAR